MQKTNKKYAKRIGIIIAVILLYIIGGAIVPFVFQPTVGAVYQEISKEIEYLNRDGISVDRASIVESSTEALDLRLAMFEEAKERIVLSTFDIRIGESLSDIFSSLLEAADRGVKVEIIVDGLYGALHMAYEPIFYLAGEHDNIEIRFYNTPNLLLPWTFNGRMHDKYILVDDMLLLLGGRNTFDYFLGDYNEKNLSYDREVLIYNTASKHAASQGSITAATQTVTITDSVIEQMYSYFETIWDSKDCKTVYEKRPFWISKDKIKSEREILSERYVNNREEKPALFDKNIDYVKLTIPIRKATLIHNPIHIFAKEPYLWYETVKLAEQALERVYLHTPYAVFSKDMYHDMTRLVQKEEKNIIMQVNSTAVGDNVMASADYTWNKKKLLQTGVKIYEFQGKHSSHGKSALFDSNLSMIGSYNLDMRSTYLDTEVALVIHGEKFNHMLEEKIMELERQSIYVDWDGNYVLNDLVEEVPLSKSKKILYDITSVLFQLIRYLI